MIATDFCLIPLAQLCKHESTVLQRLDALPIPYAKTLLEEPEISLNDAIVRQIPLILTRLQKDKKVRRQVILSTHSEALLSNTGIDARGVVLLEASHEGTKARMVNSQETAALKAGLPVSDVVLPKARPAMIEQLGLWQ